MLLGLTNEKLMAVVWPSAMIGHYFRIRFQPEQDQRGSIAFRTQSKHTNARHMIHPCAEKHNGTHTSFPNNALRLPPFCAQRTTGDNIKCCILRRLELCSRIVLPVMEINSEWLRQRIYMQSHNVYRHSEQTGPS